MKQIDNVIYNLDSLQDFNKYQLNKKIKGLKKLYKLTLISIPCGILFTGWILLIMNYPIALSITGGIFTVYLMINVLSEAQ